VAWLDAVGYYRKAVNEFRMSMQHGLPERRRRAGHHRKAHQLLREDTSYGAGNRFAAFDTSVGRLGMMICYDKAFPESARALALDGVGLMVCLSAWPASLTNRAPRMARDRQARLFDLYDQARAAENQVVLVSSNQTGVLGELCFLGLAKVAGPGGEILVRTWSKVGTRLSWPPSSEPASPSTIRTDGKPAAPSLPATPGQPRRSVSLIFTGILPDLRVRRSSPPQGACLLTNPAVLEPNRVHGPVPACRRITA
jgi:hypothetical protein